MEGKGRMTFKFERLEVWHLALDYIDVVYEIAAQLPHSEEDLRGPQYCRRLDQPN
jgi:hypothetical protein